MYCKYCGQQIPDASKFCPKCGKDLRPAQEQNNTEEKKIVLTMPETVKATLGTTPVSQTAIPAAQLKKKGFPILLVIIPLLLLLAGGIFAYFHFSNSLDPADFIIVELEEQGEGRANASVYFDYDTLNEKIGTERMKESVMKVIGTQAVKQMEEEYGLPFSEYLEEYADYVLDSRYFYTVDFDKTSDLKNGDKITFTFYPGEIATLIDREITLADINKFMGVRMPETYVYTVKGLGKADESPVITPGDSGNEKPANGDYQPIRPDLTKVDKDAIAEYCSLATLACRFSQGVEQDTSFYLDEVSVMKNKDNGMNGLAFTFRNSSGADRIIAYEDLTLSIDQKHLDFNGDSVTITNSANSNFFNTRELEKIDASYYKQLKPAVGLLGIITDSQVRIRSGPSTSSDKVSVDGKKVYIQGEAVEIVDEARDSNSDLWYQVRFKRSGTVYTYWVFGAYVRVE